MSSIFGGQKSGTKSAGTYGQISPKEAKERMAGEPGIILLDVRTAEEYAGKRIPGALLMPVDTVGQEASRVITNRASIIFVYCQAGVRAANACQELVRQGYQNVFCLGGIASWPYETKRGS